MGYILPVDHYQYNDYHKRVTQQKENKHYIEAPFKVILDQQHQENSAKYDALNRTSTQNVSRDASSDIFGMLTGKGRNFSASV
ncbi:hypothetical protein [Oceanobacillus rekensis]|uniref:hypothetical protein n=1 Tax=Oceanobacillus rekensis TaxID=937927 RepID=UPI000B42D769|nr:hypothetical protein [Oceanobacillus rekensis]